MRLRLAWAADYANRSGEGKLETAIIFYQPNTAVFSAKSQQGFRTIEWQAGPVETEA